jgi:alanyl-tRNA synthetase
MQQHHGQHLLSEAFMRVCKAQTVSFHLGKQGCSIDLDKAVAPVDLERAETLANMVIYENRAVQVHYYGREEAKSLPMRKPPPAEERIRVVTVNEFDCQACCGTHPRTTGEVGVICVTGTERQKGSTRVHFACGYRALSEARENARVLRSLGTLLSAGRDDLEKAVDRLQTDFAETRRKLSVAEKTLAEQIGRELAGRGRVIVELFDDKSLEYLRTVANQIAAVPGKIAILGGSGETSSVVLARSADLKLDLRPLFAEILAPIQGRGGGGPGFVQGGGPGKDLRASLKLAEERILANLGA